MELLWKLNWLNNRRDKICFGQSLVRLSFEGNEWRLSLRFELDDVIENTTRCDKGTNNWRELLSIWENLPVNIIKSYVELKFLFSLSNIDNLLLKWS